jgi:hypothetical protein
MVPIGEIFFLFGKNFEKSFCIRDIIFGNWKKSIIYQFILLEYNTNKKHKSDFEGS